MHNRTRIATHDVDERCISADVRMSPEEPLEVFARQVILSFFHEMMSYKQGAIEGTDIEFVHDMRVTARRLRTAMDNFAGCFEKKPFKQQYKKIKAITRTMGSVRDLDVLIARLYNESTHLTEAEQTELQGLIENLKRQRTAARKPMLTLFEELEHTGFESEFLDFFRGNT